MPITITNFILLVAVKLNLLKAFIQAFFNNRSTEIFSTKEKENNGRKSVDALFMLVIFIKSLLHSNAIQLLSLLIQRLVYVYHIQFFGDGRSGVKIATTGTFQPL